MSSNNSLGSAVNAENKGHLGRIYDEAMAADPNRTALIDGASGEAVTYGELSDRIAAAGNALKDMDVGKGDRVALCFPNELTFIYAFFGAARIGAVPVPVNIKTTQEKISSVIRDSDATLIITSVDKEVLTDVRVAASAANDVKKVAVASSELPSINGAEVVSFTDKRAAARTSLEPTPVEDDDPAMQPYTSGSTGDPKGVVLTHAGCHWMISKIHEVHFLGEDERAIVAGPLYHKNAMVGAIKVMLAVGGSVVVMDGFDPQNVIEAVSNYGVTYFRGVPAMYKLLVDADDALAEYDVSSIQWAVSGSASLPQPLIENVQQTFGCEMGEAYGLTETGGPVTLSPRWGPRKLGSSGLALPGADIRIVDPDTNEELPPGEVGELVVSCPSNGQYYERPQKEAEAYFDHDGKKFLHTDDLARQDEQGYHYIIGRIDNMLIVGGENVYPAEVENLLQGHDAVTDVSVVGVPHEIKGEAPVAFAVADGVTERELKQYTLDRGPAYSHPRRVFLLEKLPLASTGKIDRDELERIAREKIGGEITRS